MTPSLTVSEGDGGTDEEFFDVEVMIHASIMAEIPIKMELRVLNKGEAVVGDKPGRDDIDAVFRVGAGTRLIKQETLSVGEIQLPIVFSVRNDLQAEPQSECFSVKIESTDLERTIFHCYPNFNSAAPAVAQTSPLIENFEDYPCYFTLCITDDDGMSLSDSVRVHMCGVFIAIHIVLLGCLPQNRLWWHLRRQCTLLMKTVSRYRCVSTSLNHKQVSGQRKSGLKFWMLPIPSTSHQALPLPVSS